MRGYGALRLSVGRFKRGEARIGVTFIINREKLRESLEQPSNGTCYLHFDPKFEGNFSLRYRSTRSTYSHRVYANKLPTINTSRENVGDTFSVFAKLTSHRLLPHLTECYELTLRELTKAKLQINHELAIRKHLNSPFTLSIECRRNPAKGNHFVK